MVYDYTYWIIMTVYVVWFYFYSILNRKIEEDEMSIVGDLDYKELQKAWRVYECAFPLERRNNPLHYDIYKNKSLYMW